MYVKFILCFFPFQLTTPAESLRVDGTAGTLEGEAAYPSYDGSSAIYVLVASRPDYVLFDHVWMYSFKPNTFSEVVRFEPVKILTATSDVNGDIYYFAQPSVVGNSASTILYKFEAGGRKIVRVTEFSQLPVMPGFTSLVRLNSLYLLAPGGDNSTAPHLTKYSFDAKTIQKFKLPEALNRTTLSFCGYHVCIFGEDEVAGNSKTLTFDVFRHTFQAWTWRAPVSIVSNAFEIGDYVAMFNRDYNLVIVHTERHSVQVEKMEYGSVEKSWKLFTAIYVQKEKSIFIFACGGDMRSCDIFTVSLYLKYTDAKKWIGAVNVTSVTIPCGITGAPLPAVTWAKDSKVLHGAQLDEDSNLVIPSVEARHEGKYLCIAISFLAHLTREILLSVKRPTVILDWNNTLTGTAGENVLIPCNATSDNLTLNSNWLQNGTEIDWSHAPRYQKVMRSHSLLILNAEMSDSGNYTCVVWTSIDSINATLALIVEDTSVPNFILTNDHPYMSPKLLWAIILGIFAVLALGIIFSTFCYCKYKNAFRLQETELKEFLLGGPAMDNTDILEEFTDGKPYDPSYEIELNSFQIHRDTVLGFGEFGIVYKGVVMVNGKEQAVALKTSKSFVRDVNLKKQHLKCLLSELKVMIYIGRHPNIIELVGACTSKLKEGVAYVALEFCVNGNLEGLLRRSTYVENIRQYTNVFDEGKSCVTNSMLSSWVYQIANGMEFLGFKRIIHSDLATRNVLVAGDMSIRITDFGLSRRLENYGNYVKMGGEPLPWRWMAVESLDVRSFSTQSDVWSFGVTLWEIYTLGSIPYPGQVWTMDFVQELKRGQRLPPPEYANHEVYEKMGECWAFNPIQRPTFSELAKFFQSIHYKDANIVYLA